MGKSGKRIGLGVAVCGLLAVLAALAGFAAHLAARDAQRRAQAFLRDFASLDPCTMSFDDARRFTEDHRVSLWEGVGPYGHFLDLESGTLPPGCTSDHCDFRFSFQNIWLHRLLLAPLTELGAEIQVRGGKVDSTNVGLLVGPRGAVALTVQDCSGRQKTAIPGRRDPLITLVEIAPTATPAQHRGAFAFNLTCLSKIGGCKNSYQLLPSLPPGEDIRQ